MQLYVGQTEQFILDTTRNQITDQLVKAHFDYFGRRPSPSEVASWNNSLKAMALAVAPTPPDNGILVEYQLPSTSRRIDVFLAGHSASQEPRAVIVELKQWEECEPSEGERVVTWVAGAHRDVLHPSVQSDQYRQYLMDSHTAFYEKNAIALDSCAYLHNYSIVPNDPLLDAKYEQWIVRSPIFCKSDVPELQAFLNERVGGGNGNPVLSRVLKSAYRPSQKLMEHVSGVIKGDSAYVLLDEQLVVYDKIFTILRKGLHRQEKQVVIVRGGPGTGKSVIALNILADALACGHVAHYVTGSRAFTQTLWNVIGSRGRQLFRYFHNYSQADPGAVDLLVADESHRIRQTSNHRFTPKAKRSDLPQIDELLRAGKVAVFFIDDLQVVRPGEVGSVDLILQHAEAIGAAVHDFTLDIQFRCAGSDAFLNWVDTTLGIRRTANVLWEKDEAFDFQILGSLEELDRSMRERSEAGHSARLVAGYCWPWSDPLPDGTLEEDVVIGEFRRSWNAKSGAGRLAPGIPKETLWAYDPRGIDQVGCVYTAQGFEFDYVGVIWGRDLVWDPALADWRGQPEFSHDTVVKRGANDFTRLVKNTYRVLLSRGLKGCYVWFEDEATRNFVRSRIRLSAGL